MHGKSIASSEDALIHGPAKAHDAPPGTRNMRACLTRVPLHVPKDLGIYCSSPEGAASMDSKSFFAFASMLQIIRFGGE